MNHRTLPIWLLLVSGLLFCGCDDTGTDTADTAIDSFNEVLDVSDDTVIVTGCENLVCDDTEYCNLGVCLCGVTPNIQECADDDTCCGGDGCRNLEVDVFNCGACGNACGAGEFCIDGACQCGSGGECGVGESCCGSPAACFAFDAPECQCGDTACAAGQGCCDIPDDEGGTEEICINLVSDLNHCGECGNFCNVGEVCVGADCRCGGGLADCDDDSSNGCESALASDSEHCGECGNACPAGDVCDGRGACALSCQDGLTNCGGDCIDLTATHADCGACTVECEPGNVCSVGNCALSCAFGLTNCFGGCVSTEANRRHCGACGNECSPGEVCSQGICSLTCLVGTSDCGGNCVNMDDDRFNCGGCFNACASDEVCNSGSCLLNCTQGLVACDGSCVNTAIDPGNCGDCGNLCAAGEICLNGVCDLTCQAGLTECNGVCVDTDRKREHCGACGNACTTGQVCNQGTCAANCSVGLSDCSGGCVDIDSDPSNCGMCNNVCAVPNATNVCVGGACFVASCTQGFANCDGNSSNGCEAELAVNDSHCGACGNACAGALFCNSGACELPPLDYFSVVSLDTTNCSTIDHEGTTGDDRGGVAVTQNGLLVTGDNATARLGILNLSGQVGLGLRLDAMVSSLESGVLYSLGVDSATPYDNDIMGCPMTFTDLLTIDQNNGSVMGSVPLSMPIMVNSCDSNGLFSGARAMLFFDNNTSNTYRIDYGTGVVTALGSNAFASLNGCDNWADWGIAESWDNDDFMVYRSYTFSGESIVRTRVSDGTTEELAVFANLSNMCSLTFAPALNRWYWHYEGGGEFGGISETAGYCDGIFSDQLCSDLTNCMGTCTDTLVDTDNCGGCGTVCPAMGQLCNAGSCECPAGEMVCGGQCINTATDINNCGGCGTVCPTPGQICNAGSCECPAGEMVCGGQCIDTQSDPMNCGGCGTTCAMDEFCASGMCTTCAGTVLVADWNGYEYWTVPVVGTMTDPNILAACQQCGLEVPCQALAGCGYNDGICLQTNNENSCGNPMLRIAQLICSGNSPPSCAPLNGVYQYMGNNWFGGCGTESGSWCSTGNSISNRNALCVRDLP